MSWAKIAANAIPLIEHYCMHCNVALDSERVEFLRDSGRPCVCVRCSEENPRLTLMEYGHKTAGYLVVVPRGDEQKALRAYKRSR
jgi:hypothetical protein